MDQTEKTEKLEDNFRQGLEKLEDYHKRQLEKLEADLKVSRVNIIVELQVRSSPRSVHAKVNGIGPELDIKITYAPTPPTQRATFIDGNGNLYSSEMGSIPQ